MRKFTEKHNQISLEDFPAVVRGQMESFQAKLSIYQMSCFMSFIEREVKSLRKIHHNPQGKYQISKLLILIATCWKLENRIKSSPTHEIDFESRFCTSRLFRNLNWNIRLFLSATFFLSLIQRLLLGSR